MINAWDYAYDNFNGENKKEIVDAIVEQIVDEMFESCDAYDGVNAEVVEQLEDSVRNFVEETIDFGQIEKQLRDNSEDYYERQQAMKGDY